MIQKGNRTKSCSCGQGVDVNTYHRLLEFLEFYSNFTLKQPIHFCFVYIYVIMQTAQWEPSRNDSYEGTVVWEKWNDPIGFDLTIYKDTNATEATSFEKNEWTLTVMSEDSKGKKHLLASGKLLLDQFAGIEPVNKKDIVDMPLRVECDNIKAVSIRYSIACTFIKEGTAT